MLNFYAISELANLLLHLLYPANNNKVTLCLFLIKIQYCIQVAIISSPERLKVVDRLRDEFVPRFSQDQSQQHLKYFEV